MFCPILIDTIVCIFSTCRIGGMFLESRSAPPLPQVPGGGDIEIRTMAGRFKIFFFFTYLDFQW